MPDQVFVGHSTRAIRNRYVYTRFTFHPSGLTGLGSAFGLSAFPTSDIVPCAMNMVHYNDIEYRGLEQSVYIGQKNSPQESVFKLKI